MKILAIAFSLLVFVACKEGTEVKGDPETVTPDTSSENVDGEEGDGSSDNVLEDIDDPNQRKNFTAYCLNYGKQDPKFDTMVETLNQQAAEQQGKRPPDLNLCGIVFAAVSKAEIINLASNGVLKYDDISPLTGVTGTEVLNLASNQITDLSPIADMRNLTAISIANNLELSDISVLSELKRLSEIQAFSTSIADLSPLQTLTTLKQVNLESSLVTDISALSASTGLEVLDLGSLAGVTSISALTGFQNLTEVYLEETGVTDLTPIASSTGITRLNISETGITDLSPLDGMMEIIEFTAIDTNIVKAEATCPTINVSAVVAAFCAPAE